MTTVEPPVRESGLDPAIAARLKRTPDGLVCAVVQQADTREVLMVAWMDDEALHRTLTTGRATYWSRSREDTGSRATRRATSSTCARSGSTATATRCSWSSTRSARPATPATARASTPTVLLGGA